jgi:peptidoglycan/LPS O-acetylase OafA/YrhL
MATAHYNDFGKWAAPPKFWWRRACRIYPMYWLGLIIPLFYLYRQVTPWRGLMLLSLPPVPMLDFIPPAWTLHYEIAFYLMFGLCLLPYIGKPLLAVWVLAVIWVSGPPEFFSAIGLPPPTALTSLAAISGGHFISIFEFYFFAGLAAGWAFASLRPDRNASIAVLALSLLWLLSCLPLIEWGNSFGQINHWYALGWQAKPFGFKLFYGPSLMAPLIGIGMGGIMLGLAGLERHGVLRFGRLASRLGAISYPLYILHASLLLWVNIEFAGLKLGPAGLYAMFIVTAIGIFGLCAAITFTIDQPVQKLLRRAKWRWPARLRRGATAGA